MAGNSQLAGKLWGGASSSSSDSSDSSEDDQPVAQPIGDKKPTRKMWADESSSDDEPTTKRKVVSHTDKRYEQMKESIKQMKNHQKVNDFAALITDFEQLLKMLDKLKALVDQDGGPPGFFIKACANLEQYCDKMHAEHLENKANKGQRLTENKQRAFNTLRSKVRKGNKTYQDLIEKCKEDPEQFGDAQGDESEGSDNDDSDSSGSDGNADSSSSGSSSGSSDSDSDSSSGSGSSSDSDDDSDSSSSDGDSSGSSEQKSWKSGTDDSDEEGLDDEAAREKKMLRWLITPEQEEKRKKEAAEKKPDDPQRRKEKKLTTKRSTKELKEVDVKQAGANSGAKKEYTEEELLQKVTEVSQQRGKRGFDKKEYMAKLSNLEEHAMKQGPRFHLYILVTMTSADFDNTGSLFEAMKISQWNEAREKVCKMLPLLIESHEQLKEEGETVTEEEDPKAHSRLQDLFVHFVGALDDELEKALQYTVDVYGSEYQDVLANSSKFLVLLKRVYHFFEDTKQAQPLGLISLRLMQQLHYKPDMLNRAVFEAICHEVPAEQKSDWIWPKDSAAFMAKLCNYVYAAPRLSRHHAEVTDSTVDAGATGASSDKPYHWRATLYQVYHLALHDHFDSARNLLQLGSLYDHAMESLVNIQILYNRVIAQMGLCAFRLGKIADAHTFLMDVCMHNKARELLAQGLSFQRNMDKTPEQDRAERLRQLPYHMHINLEVLETAHHISAMLLEVPNLAMESMHPDRKRTISRAFRRELERYEKQPFTGPPENPKEAVVCAARSLQNGDWLSACNVLDDLKLWDHVDAGDPEHGKRVKAMIKEKIQIEGLRTYFFAYASIYDAFDLDQLVGMFELPPKLAHSVVSKMMIRDEISAFWDESSKFVLMQPFERTPLQRLALTLAEKGAQAVQNNEQLVDHKSGGYGLKSEPQGRWDDPGAASGRGRFGKGGGSSMDAKGKGKGRGKSSFGSSRPATMRGWENARAGARGNTQRGWATGTRG